MESIETLRPYLFAIAYRMLGSVEEAEDIVQEALLRYLQADPEADSPKAYLAAVTTRLAIDQLRSARRRREVYPGDWLPEPLIGDEPLQHAEIADSLSLAFLHLLERLSPTERAVFLLREVFDYDYIQVASIVGKSEINCRQILTRARRHLKDDHERAVGQGQEHDSTVRRFVAAWQAGDTASMLALLAPNATIYGDGGGKAQSIRKPIVGAELVATALTRWKGGAAQFGATIHFEQVNSHLGLTYRLPDGTVIGAADIQIHNGQVIAIRSIVNPDKLTRAQPPP